MKALITGAGGQLGRALLAKLPAGWTAVPLTRSDVDLADYAALRRLVDLTAPNLILNAAAYTAVDRAERDEDAAFAINAGAVQVLSAAASRSGARLVHVSTDFVFDGESPRAYKPNDLRRPLSVYGRSKAAGEDAAGPEAAIVRTSWVYGIRPGNFVSTMLKLMRDRDEVRVVADQIGSPTWVEGLAEAVWALGTRRCTGIWHHSDAGVASWYDFAVAIQEEAAACGLLSRMVPIIPIATADYPTPAHRPAFSVLDADLTRAELGTSAIHWRTNLRSTMREMARLKQNV